MSGGSNSQGVKLRAQATSMRVKIDEACSSRRPGKRNLPKPEVCTPKPKRPAEPRTNFTSPRARDPELHLTEP